MIGGNKIQGKTYDLSEVEIVGDCNKFRRRQAYIFAITTDLGQGNDPLSSLKAGYITADFIDDANNIVAGVMVPLLIS